MYHYSRLTDLLILASLVSYLLAFGFVAMMLPFGLAAGERTSAPVRLYVPEVLSPDASRHGASLTLYPACNTTILIDKSQPDRTPFPDLYLIS